ncbi:MAG: hypothetical protein NTY77_20780 [Elusimicrobia bacterium]|nr:hypothetical protein [Elusimicrobiota bacterium]
MKIKLAVLAAALAAVCAGAANAQEPITISFNGATYTFDRPALTALAPRAQLARTNNQQNMALAKIKLNPYHQDMNDTLIATLQPGLDVYAVVRELYLAGFKAQSYSDDHGYYYIAVDVAGVDAADSAIGLAKYYYVTQVFVGKKVYDALFPPGQP